MNSLSGLRVQQTELAFNAKLNSGSGDSTQSENSLLLCLLQNDYELKYLWIWLVSHPNILGRAELYEISLAKLHVS